MHTLVCIDESCLAASTDLVVSGCRERLSGEEREPQFPATGAGCTTPRGDSSAPVTCLGSGGGGAAWGGTDDNSGSPTLSRTDFLGVCMPPFDAPLSLLSVSTVVPLQVAFAASLDVDRTLAVEQAEVKGGDCTATAPPEQFSRGVEGVARDLAGRGGKCPS